jgi:sterol desaturase/sphingolipid hydroxylase (fatty acid hydroxylase superfamily)
MAGSCKKYVEIPPPDDKITADAVFTNANSIASAMTGLYAFSFGPSEEPTEINMREPGRPVWHLRPMRDSVMPRTTSHFMITVLIFLTNYLGLLWSAPIVS